MGRRRTDAAQFGNTCYCNSVLQALFHHAAVRARVRSAARKASAPPLLRALAQLFAAIADNERRSGVVAPETFLRALRAANRAFASAEQQDAHELLNYLLNELGVAELAELFRGSLTNHTRCLCCESVTRRDEPFLDLSLDIVQNSSLSHWCARARARARPRARRSPWLWQL